MCLCFGVSTANAASASALDDFTRAYARISAYQVIITVAERRGVETDKRVLAYRFDKPSHAVMHVVSGKNAGATLTWDGGPSLVARKGSGLLSMFTKTFSIHDTMVTTIRGSSIDELSFGAILTDLRRHRRQIHEINNIDVSGISTITVSISSASGTLDDTGLTRENIMLSEKTHLPIRAIGYEGNSLVREVDFRSFVPSA